MQKSINTKSTDERGHSDMNVGKIAMGAALGAVVVGAAGVALSSEKNRKKVGKLASEVGKYATKIADSKTASELLAKKSSTKKISKK